MVSKKGQKIMKEIIANFFRALTGREELAIDYNSQIRQLLQLCSIESEADPRVTIRDKAPMIRQQARVKKLSPKQRERVDALSKERGYRLFRMEVMSR
jgi:hypothetical protein